MNVGHSYVDGESSGSEQSIDDKLGIPSVVTPRVRKTRDVLSQRLEFAANGYKEHLFTW